MIKKLNLKKSKGRDKKNEVVVLNDDGKEKNPTLTEKAREAKLVIDTNNQSTVLVEMSWTVKAFSGEVDLDGACLLFNKYGRFVETIFWDNLSTKGITHLGDEVIVTNEDSENEDDNEGKEEEEKEYIEVNFEKISKSVTTLVFVLNIFSNKTFTCLTNLSLAVLSGARENGEQKKDVLARFKVPPNKLKTLREFNSLVIAKIFKKSFEDNDWYIRVISEPHVIPSGQVVDILIPHIIRKKQVEPLVATWDKIIITVVEGRGLTAEDLNGKSDPYVKMYCQDWKQKTKIQKQTLNPVWEDAIFELDYKQDRQQILFKVLDHDRIGKDDFLGMFTVSIPKIPPNKELNRWFRLEGQVDKQKKVTGSIFIKLLKQASSH